jgi:VWFA-related protein
MNHGAVRRTLVAVLIGVTPPAVLAAAAAGGSVEVAAQGLTRSVYAIVTDDDGVPVMDMRADEFDVREDGRTRTIVSARPSTTPLRVALIVSDRGRGQFQLGALRFVEALLGRADISITGIVIQPELLTDFTSDTDALRNALLRLGRRSTAPDTGAQLIEAIVDATKTVRREGWRSAIVVIRAGGEAPTSISAPSVHEALRRSGAVFYAISPIGTVGRSWPDMYAESRLIVPSVLGDGTRESGGREVDVVVNTMVPAMQQVASELLNQYEITYTLPAGTKPSDRVSVRGKRPDVTVRAPTRTGG